VKFINPGVSWPLGDTGSLLCFRKISKKPLRKYGNSPKKVVNSLYYKELDKGGLFHRAGKTERQNL
jgi:hypothetical protein